MNLLKLIVLRITAIFPCLNWFFGAILFKTISGALEGTNILLDFKSAVNRKSSFIHRYIAFDNSLSFVKLSKLKSPDHFFSPLSRNKLIRKTLWTLDFQIYPLYFLIFSFDFYHLARGTPYDLINGKFLILIIVISFELPVLIYLIYRSIRFKKMMPVIVSVLTLLEWLVRKAIVYVMPALGVFFSIGELQGYLRRIGLYIIESKEWIGEPVSYEWKIKKIIESSIEKWS